MASRLTLYLLIPVLLLTAGPLFGKEHTTSELEHLVAQALEVNPELRVAEERWNYFTQQALQAGALDDPMLMLGVRNMFIREPTNFRLDPMTSKVIGISQMLPFPGKRGLKRDAAELDAESYRWLHQERRLELARMVKESWYRLYYLEHALELVEANIAAVDDLIAISESMYGVGKGRQQDLFKAHLERSRMLNMQIMLQQQRTGWLAALNALIYRPAATEITIPAALDLAPPPPTTALADWAENNRPILKSLRARIARGEAGQRLARREYYPDFTLALEYMQREPAMNEPGDDLYSLTLSFNLPLQRERRQARVAEAGAETRGAAAEINELRNSIQAGIADLTSRLVENRSRVELYRDAIIPQADLSLEAATAAYQVGRSDFMALLDSRMVLFEYQRQLHETMAEYHIAMARLEALVGGWPGL